MYGLKQTKLLGQHLMFSRNHYVKSSKVLLPLQLESPAQIDIRVGNCSSQNLFAAFLRTKVRAISGPFLSFSFGLR